MSRRFPRESAANKQERRLHRLSGVPALPLRPGETVRIRGQRWSVTSPGGPILYVRGCDPGNRHAAAAFLAAVEQIERLPPPTVRVVRPSRWWREVRRRLAEAGPPESLVTAAAAHIDVLPYQLEPALAVIRGVGVRLLIADEVGLGKTIEAGLIITELLARWRDARALVVAPAGLREQWQAELRRRFSIDAALLDSTSLAAAATAAPAGGNPWSAAAVGIVSIDFVKRAEVIRSLETLVWDLVVFDEAHGLAGRTDRAAAARAIAERARTVVMLTATPHSGDDAALARLARVGDIAGRFPLVVFRRTRRDAGLAEARRTTWLRVQPAPSERAMHAALMDYAGAVWTDRGATEPAARLAMTVLARRACSSAASLARSLERRLRLLADAGPGNTAPEPPQLMLPLAGDDVDDQLLSAAGLGDPAGERRILTDLLRLAGLASLHESKPALLRRFLRRARQPAVVFTEYRDTLGFLAGALASFTPVLLHGGLTASERRSVIGAFTRGDASILLATDAASEGLNLHQRCRLVINLELPWTPLRLEQRIGRVERIGQRQAVHAVHLIGGGTSEEATVATLVRRMQRVEHAVDALRSPAMTEQQVAAAVFGEADARPAATAGARPRLIVPDLRSAAIGEAERIRQVRALGPLPPRPPGLRPIVTRRRRHGLPFAACCVYRFVLADSNQAFIAECLSALAVDRPSWPAAANVRGRLTAIEHLFRPQLADRHDASRAAFIASRAAAVGLAIGREEAILGVLTGRQSRLAFALLQPGLFDRRAERAADAQQAVLRAAAERCHERLRTLRLLAAPVAAGHALLCAILTD
jgi:superfamily II DNA or RNA helicase